MRSWESRDGTCLMETRIFMEGGSAGESLEDQAAVGAAESEGIRQRVVDFHGTGFVRDVVQVAPAAGSIQVHGGRADLIARRQHGDACFETTRAAEQMAGHGFGGAD